MEGSLVETRSILEAGSVVPPGRRIPSGELWGGNPARFIRTLTNEDTVEIPKLAVAINHLSGDYFSEFLPYSTVYLESYSAEISPELAPLNRRPASSATEPTKPTESLVEGHHRIRDDETKPETPSAATADVSRAATRQKKDAPGEGPPSPPVTFPILSRFIHSRFRNRSFSIAKVRTS
ncbi:Trimeric LpxA-like superfamily [Arabidopsis suecica]|uniref:Trimeric LpxA-like superfamily n=1 Tax=Arabidopsis suecica TaxID=45249 RepID=A0A8T1XUD1_ARASU|nr:Trimeric LpxA-like superfamily [Arabidopsis suecica]